jgi:metallophosphoesterase superfamily enzyme
MTDLPLAPGLLATPYRFLWHPATATAILADLHLGGQGAPQGTVGPRLAEAWRALATRHPRHVVLAGDLLDDPAAAASQVPVFQQLMKLLPPACRLTLTPGNHDPAGLGTTLGIESLPEVLVGKHLISHGHLPPSTRPKTWIVGHQHPAVILRTRVQSAKMACYAVCHPSATNPQLIILPAFTHDAGDPLGSNLLTGHHWLLPIPRPTANKIRIYGLIEPKPGTKPQVLDFGPLTDLR